MTMTEPLPDHSMLQSSAWWHTAAPAPPTRPLEADAEADTLIVGAGYTGLSAALALAKAGRRVVVLEAREIGWGGSGRNAGHVNPIPPHGSPDVVRALLGPQRFEAFAQAALGAADEVFDLIETEKIDCGARRNGCLRGHHTAEAADLSDAAIRGWADLGAEIIFMDGRGFEQAFGSRAYVRGHLIANCGAVNPLGLVRGLAHAVLRAGGTIHTGTPVDALRHEEGCWRLRCGNATARAAHLLVCTNAYSDGLWPGLAQSVIPLSSVQIATGPLSNNLTADIMPLGAPMIDTRRSPVFCRKDADGSIVIGTAGRLTASGDRAAFDWLRREAARLFPSLAGVEWRHAWEGRIAMNREHIPQVHRLGPGAWTGIGYNGRGLALACVMGRVLAEQVLGAAEEDLPFPVSEIRPYPFHALHPPVARARLVWMRLRDRADLRQVATPRQADDV